MHPALSAFPSDAFYGGSLQNGVARSEREARASSCGIPWPAGAGTPLMFWSVPGREETSVSGTSFLNVSEADAVEAVVTALLRAGGARPDEVGVITPYEGQRARVRHALAARGPLSKEIYDAVEVASVDGFQGREKEFVVFSAVRTGGLATMPATNANDGGGGGGGHGHHHFHGHRPPPSLSGAAVGIGFLADPRRLNVALTRARSGVVLIGSPEPLARHALWAALLARVAAAGALVEGPLAALRPASAPAAATKGVDAGEFGFFLFFFAFFSSFRLFLLLLLLLLPRSLTRVFNPNEKTNKKTAWWALSGAERKAARAAQAAAVEAAAQQAAAAAVAQQAAAAAQQFYGSGQMMQPQQQYYYPSTDPFNGGGGAASSAFAIGGGGIGGGVGGGQAPSSFGTGAPGTYSHF